MSMQLIFLSGILFLLARSEPTQDKVALLDFANSVNHSKPLNWDSRASACFYWIGITCNTDETRVISVRLPGFGFEGPVPSNTLSRLSALQILNLRRNRLSGPFPSDVLELRNLTTIDLQFNNFEGPLPLDFSVWTNLSVINLSHNAFNGGIPSSISKLTYLTALTLSYNSLSGEVPDLNVPSLQLLDLSYNNLTGILPPSLVRFPQSAFTGNQLSSQVPSQPPVPPPLPSLPNQQPKINSSKLAEPALLAIIIGGCAVGFVIIAVLMYLWFSKSRDHNKEPKRKSQRKEGFIKKEKKAVSNSQNGDGKLVFFEHCILAFDLEDLLRASAEILGKGTFGTTYKAALEDGAIVVVKRLKEATVGKREFEVQMEAVGKVQHDNVAPIRAYYYSKDEKLMVYDYYACGNVSTMLHAKRGEKRVPLDWETRLKIAIGAARGIHHIHSESGGKLVHGNIKASNIFLNLQNYGSISDLGLATLMTPNSTPVIHTPGYRAPELTDTRKVSQASDVYSYGVLLLELLTGKSPIYTTGGDEVVHLVRWVHSVVREEWTAEVFDIELLRYPNIEEEMVEMLRIGMSCVARMPEQRPKMANVLKMVEDIRRGDAGNSLSGPNTEDSTPARTPIAFEIASSSNQH